jgi:hypothetical protein
MKVCALGDNLDGFGKWYGIFHRLWLAMIIDWFIYYIGEIKLPLFIASILFFIYRCHKQCQKWETESNNSL